MSPQTYFENLSGTSSRTDALQPQLLTQFKKGQKLAGTGMVLLDEAGSMRTMEWVSAESEKYESPQPPVLWIPPDKSAQRAVALQKWEGMVTATAGDTFIARLKDLTVASPEEEIELSIQDISEDDRELVQLGAIFYCSIGYETTATGQKKRTTVIRFRRLPVWRALELSAVKREAEEIRRAIGWGEQIAAAQAG